MLVPTILGAPFPSLRHSYDPWECPNLFQVLRFHKNTKKICNIGTKRLFPDLARPKVSIELDEFTWWISWSPEPHLETIISCSSKRIGETFQYQLSMTPVQRLLFLWWNNSKYVYFPCVCVGHVYHTDNGGAASEGHHCPECESMDSKIVEGTSGDDNHLLDDMSPADNPLASTSANKKWSHVRAPISL